MRNYRKITTGLIVGWFTVVLSASGLHLFKNDANRVGLAVRIAALTPLVVFSVWFVASERFRQFALSSNPEILTAAQTWRIIAGFVFVLLEARGVLPAIFALPAGYGDMAIGATASYVAWKFANPSHQSGFIVWQLLGITDLLLAVSLGTTAGLLSPQGASMGAVTVLPLSLIPTFVVPLCVIFHVICIAQARTWKIAPEIKRQTVGSLQQAAVR